MVGKNPQQYFDTHSLQGPDIFVDVVHNMGYVVIEKQSRIAIRIGMDIRREDNHHIEEWFSAYAVGPGNSRVHVVDLQV